MPERERLYNHPNFSYGLASVDLPAIAGLSEKKSGKVRDMWSFGDTMIIATTDRVSAFDHVLGTIPRRGQILNLLSAFWFEMTRDIIDNHVLSIPHPNVLIARKVSPLPVEIVVRDFFATSSSSTSVYSQYQAGRRTIYGLEFPEGLMANQRLPERVITPTTKATVGHDAELTDDQARFIVDSQFGSGRYAQAKKAVLALFERGSQIYAEAGIIMADSKYELGVDKEGNLIWIDEAHTPDCSRFWDATTYQKRLKQGENPDNLDKELLRRWLVKRGFQGTGEIPLFTPHIRNQMTRSYQTLYETVTHKSLSSVASNNEEIATAILNVL